MQAIIYEKYGEPTEVMKLKEVAKPVPKADEVLIKVKAVSLNASDKEFVYGTPAYVRMWGLQKPKYSILGSDVTGIIEAVGEEVTQFKVGDEVLGDIMYAWGGFAEYVGAKASSLVLKPANRSFEEVATLPQAAVVVLQGLRDKGQIKPGQQVLINGAGGGSGTFAIQLAKHYGTEVTGIDNTGKLAFMRSVGADHVIDYTKEDFVEVGRKYDFILDLVAHRSLFDYKKVLKPQGKYLLVGGLMKRLLQVAFLGAIFSKKNGQQFSILEHKQNTKDLTSILELYEAGKITPCIDKNFPLAEVPQAIAYLASGQAKGKVMISFD